MKRNLLFILILALFLSACAHIPGETVVNKTIEQKEWHRNGKLNTENIYFIETEERVYEVEEQVYHSYNVGDEIFVRGKTGLMRYIVERYR